MLHWKRLKWAKRGIEVEIVDLRTILPFDAKTCIESVRRTGRLIVLQESQYTGGLDTVSSRILEEAFWNLENAPVVIGAIDTPVPFSLRWKTTLSYIRASDQTHQEDVRMREMDSNIMSGGR